MSAFFPSSGYLISWTHRPQATALRNSLRKEKD